MPRPIRPRIFRPALQIAAAQLMVGLLSGTAWLMFTASPGNGLAALAGGVTPALLNVYMAIRLPQDGNVPAEVFLAAFYRAQAMKLGLAVGLLALAAMVFADQFPALITTLALALAMHWFALLWAR